MSSNSRRGLTLLRTRSHKLDIEVASLHQNASNLKTYKICNEGPVEYEYHLLFICSTYNVIQERFDDILRRCDNLSIILKAPPRKLSTYVHTLTLTQRVFYPRYGYPFLRRRHPSRTICKLGLMGQNWPSRGR